MADKFTFTAAQRANLRTELATTLLYTELSGDKAVAYKFSFAGTGNIEAANANNWRCAA